ncbi:MAG: SDR family oxidoreductase [Sphingomonadaceae bacterium]|nr:SDR family oxidoreductase [Sphingomonadaceae bacterium]
MAGAFAGKVVAVTGGGRGIGRAIAQAFAAESAKVVIGARTPSYADEAVAAIARAGGTVVMIENDISRETDCQTLVATAVERFGGLDILVHAAADIPNGGIDATDEAIRRGFDSIVMAAFWLTRAARPHLAKSGEGRIITIGSICGPTTMVLGRMAYGVCKSALDAFVRGAALELASEGITVNSIEPGMIASARPVANMGIDVINAIGARSPVGRAGTSDEIAHATLFLASPGSGFITGTSIVADGGSTISNSDTPIKLADHQKSSAASR